MHLLLKWAEFLVSGYYVSWKCLLVLVSVLTSNQMITLPQGLNIYIKFISYLLDVVLPPYRYIHFDFHHVCHGGNFDNLQALYNQIEEAIHKQGYFSNI